jgi:hypothetical protein
MFFSSLVIDGKQEAQKIEVNPVDIEKQTPFKIREPAPVKINVSNSFYTGYTPFVNPANKQIGVPEFKTKKIPEQHEVPTRSKREFMPFSNS